MVISAKHDGPPRHTVDHGPLNLHCPKQAHHTIKTWHSATLIPKDKRERVLDHRHGYYSLSLAPGEGKDLRSSEDGFTDRMDGQFSDFEQSKRWTDDTLLHNDIIEQQSGASYLVLPYSYKAAHLPGKMNVTPDT